MNEIPIETLRQLLIYNSETGDLFWKPRPIGMFPTQLSYKAWNTRWAGKKAFTYKSRVSGYLSGRIFYTAFLAHRVCWALYYGEWPDDQIDHENHIRSDNRIKNLKSVEEAKNHKNMSLSKVNTSGVCGVCWSEEREKWVAYITIDYKVVSLGRFVNFDEAVAKRKAAETENEFHPNHGMAA